MIEFIKEVSSIFIVAVLVLAMVFGSVFFIGNKFDKRNCKKYMEETGIHTKYIDYDTCYMLDKDRFVSKEEFITRQQSQNVNLDKLGE